MKDVAVVVTKSCPSLCDPMNCRQPGSSARGISQVRILGSELPFPSPGDLPDPWVEPASPALAGGFFTTKLPGKPPASRFRNLFVKILNYAFL